MVNPYSIFEINRNFIMSDAPKTIERPLSPHLQVYNLPMMARMSISHRITGVLLTVGLVLLSLWIIAAGMGEETYNQAMALIDTPVTRYVFVAWAFMLFYHLCNGFRHVLWDIGFGLNEKASVKSGIWVLVATVLLTYGVWSLSCGCYKSLFVKVAPMTEEVAAEQGAK